MNNRFCMKQRIEKNKQKRKYFKQKIIRKLKYLEKNLQEKRKKQSMDN